jgi:hypothetical protein
MNTENNEVTALGTTKKASARQNRATDESATATQAEVIACRKAVLAEEAAKYGRLQEDIRLTIKRLVEVSQQRDNYKARAEALAAQLEQAERMLEAQREEGANQPLETDRNLRDALEALLNETSHLEHIGPQVNKATAALAAWDKEAK